MTDGMVPRWMCGVALASAGALLLCGCTGTRTDETPRASPPAEPPTASAAASELPAPRESEPIEFAFQPPDPVCPPVSELEILPSADEYPYALVDPSLHEREQDFFTLCTYQRADIGDGEDMALEDHVLVTSQMTLYRSWEDSFYQALYPELPVDSENLADWDATIGAGWDRGVWWEGCGSAAPCREGDAPTVRTRAWELSYQGHVANLEFYGSVIYVSRRLPSDVNLRAIAILRDFVSAALEGYERRG